MIVIPPLTPAQSEALKAIINHQEKHSRPPSYRELGQSLGLSPMGARCQVMALEAKGYLSRIPYEYRGIQVLRRGDETLPLQGEVQAGCPVVVWDQLEEVSFADFFRPGNQAMRVADDSLEHAHIIQGDYVVAGPSDAAGNRIVGIIRRVR